MAVDLDGSSEADKLQRKIPTDYSRKHTMASLPIRRQLKAFWIYTFVFIIIRMSQCNAPSFMMPTLDSVNMPSIKPMYEMVSTGSDDDQSTNVAINICDSSAATGNDLPATINFIKCTQD